MSHLPLSPMNGLKNEAAVFDLSISFDISSLLKKIYVKFHRFM